MEPKDTALADRNVVQLLRPLATAAARVARGTIDLRTPRAAQRQIRPAVDAIARGVEAAFPRLRATMADHVVALGRAPIATPKGPRAAQLVAYFRALDQRFPMATFLLMSNHLPVRGEAAMTTTRAAGHLFYASRLRGERRSNELRAVALALEVTYGALVDIVYAAECLTRGTTMKRESFGSRLARACDWTSGSLPGVLVRRVNRLRNAAAHHNWSYDDDSDVVILRDGAWTETYRLPDLYRELRERYEDLGLLMEVGRCVAMPSFARMLIGAGVERVLRATSTSPALDGTFVERQLRPTHDQLDQLGWSWSD